MPSPTQRRGGLAEDQAVLFLQRQGFVILDRHVTSRYGEIDILAQDKETIVAVEVKARQSRRFGAAIEAVTPKKIGRIVAALNEAIEQRHWSGRPVRVDVVTLDGDIVRHWRGVE